jgi:hypothetical protein
MLDPEIDRINKIWETEGKKLNLIPPEIPLVFDKSGEQYFVYEDYSTILRIYLNKSNIAYVVPKKYFSIVEGKYFIKDIFKFQPVSCPKKNKYQKFVLEYLVI